MGGKGRGYIRPLVTEKLDFVQLGGVNLLGHNPGRIAQPPGLRGFLGLSPAAWMALTQLQPYMWIPAQLGQLLLGGRWRRLMRCHWWDQGRNRFADIGRRAFQAI